jgi:uncharacterized protein
MSDTSDTQINVAQLLKSPVGATRHYDIEATVPSLADEAELTGPVVGEVRLTRTSEGVLAQGHFRTEVKLECDRCLATFNYPIDVNVEEQYVPTVDVNTGRWLEVEETDPALLIDKHHIVDLEEVFRQGIYLEIPMHSICRPDCRGLCPCCGKNLNEGPCDCRDDEADPRWETLRVLLKER